jgi:modulator of FtsH protease HflK
MGVPGTPEGDKAPALPSLSPSVGGYVLTADTNIVHVTVTLHYRVQDAVVYAFSFSDASNVVQNVLDGAIMFAAAHTPLDQALKQPDVFKARVLNRVDDMVSRLKLGITPEPSEVRVVAPGWVQPDIDAVKTAESTSAEKVNKAKGVADSLLALSLGEVSTITNSAAAESGRSLLEMQEFAASYQKQLPEYKKNPELYRQRLLTETWQQVLASASDKFILPDRADGRPRELRFQINRDPDKPKQAEESKPGEAKP